MAILLYVVAALGGLSLILQRGGGMFWIAGAYGIYLFLTPYNAYLLLTPHNASRATRRD